MLILKVDSPLWKIRLEVVLPSSSLSWLVAACDALDA